MITLRFDLKCNFLTKFSTKVRRKVPNTYFNLWLEQLWQNTRPQQRQWCFRVVCVKGNLHLWLWQIFTSWSGTHVSFIFFCNCNKSLLASSSSFTCFWYYKKVIITIMKTYHIFSWSCKSAINFKEKEQNTSERLPSFCINMTFYTLTHIYKESGRFVLNPKTVFTKHKNKNFIIKK